jgi:hypothetical protein
MRGVRALERGRHRLKHPGIDGRVVVDEQELGTAGLRFPSTLVAGDALGPRRGRAGDDAVRVHYGGRHVERHPGGHHRPVRAPHHQRPHRVRLGGRHWSPPLPRRALTVADLGRRVPAEIDAGTLPLHPPTGVPLVGRADPADTAVPHMPDRQTSVPSDPPAPVRSRSPGQSHDTERRFDGKGLTIARASRRGYVSVGQPPARPRGRRDGFGVTGWPAGLRRPSTRSWSNTSGASPRSSAGISAGLARSGLRPSPDCS